MAGASKGLDDQLAAMMLSDDSLLASAGLADNYLVRRVSLSELFNNCVRTVLQQGLVFTLPIFIMCFLFKVLCHTVGEGFEETGMSFLPRQIIHVSSGCLGVVILHHLFQELTLLVLLQGLLAYFVIQLAHSLLNSRRMTGVCTVAISLVFHLICQLLLSAESWHKIRGPLMILSLKVVSIGFDLDRQLLMLVPGVFEFFGYAFNVGTVVFGPWVAFLDYMTIIQIKDRGMNISWLLTSLRAYILSICCLLYSTCFSNWIIIDGSHKWLIAFRDAQSFRFSHYFTCYTSEATAIASGIGATRHKEGGQSETRWDLRVSKPTQIELPRSLVDVVSNWNLPMHKWLKQYVFKQTIDFGRFPAIFLTYIASSILHGLNFQLSAVLLSIGVYSYIEFVLRQKLASIFSLCIESRPCSADSYGQCSRHRHRPQGASETRPHSDRAGGERPARYAKVNASGAGSDLRQSASANQNGRQHASSSWARRLANACFTALAIFHLSYLGLLFDTSPIAEQGYSYQHTLAKWAELDYLSHLVAGLSFGFYLLIN